MKSIRLMSLAAVSAMALLLPSTAHAETYKGWYVSGLANMSFQRNADSDISGLAKSEIEYMTGWGLSGSGGYNWGNGLRNDLELVYRNSMVESVEPSVLGDGGGIHNFALMANVFYDYDTGTRVTPYVGLGVGGSRVDADNMRHIAVNSVIDDTQYAFAYQAIAGFALKLEGNWSFTADYRYFATPEVDFETASGANAKTENASHNIMMGVRYQFNEPEAAPALIPAPVPVAAPMTVPVVIQSVKVPQPRMPQPIAPIVAEVPQSYVVFFNFDRSVLTPEAKRIIASAAADFKQGKYVRLVVTGHTDTSGSTRYNKRLSDRRASAVREEIASLGIPASAVAAAGEGESSLMIPTTDGVREAQNRRAVIILQ